ncbi:MAG: TetR/AcrR family transcriptional regulator [Actinomycetota bacterium]
MAVPYQQTGRVQQKRRTLEALIRATRTLLANGVTPTVEQVAAEASVSRTTAYRYFPTQHALLLAAYPEIGQESVLGNDPPQDVGSRFDIVFTEMARQVTENEGPLRAMLRLSLEAPSQRGQLLLRRGRRRTWIADALAPLRERMAQVDLDRLVLAVSVATGIEAFVWLTDIAELSPQEALEIMRFSAETLLEGAT